MKTRSTLLVTALLVVVAACQDKRAEPRRGGDSASVVVAATAGADGAELAEAERPVPADRVFDDFIYNFMNDEAFQRRRVSFPLPARVDGANHAVARGEWSHDRLYAADEAYAMIFDSEESVAREKDPDLDHVTVERVALRTGRVRQYAFERREGVWMLVGISEEDIDSNANSDFYVFYQQFATDSEFQLAHIDNPFTFKTFDLDSFQEIDGLLDVAQWPDYSPNMPSDTLTNINYAQTYGSGGRRVLILTSPSAGTSSTLVFERRRDGWHLVALEAI